jgi:Transposase IS66 family
MEKINSQQVDELREWVRTEAKGLADGQAALLLSMLDMVSILLRDKTTQKKAVETLRQLMGILPKSERGKSDKFDLPDKPAGQAADTEKEALERQIRKLLLKHRRLYGHKRARHGEGRRKRQERSSPHHGGEEDLYNKTSRSSAMEKESLDVNKEKQFTKTRGLRSSREDHVRYDFDVVIKEITYSVETVTDPESGQTVRASTAQVGPPGWQITWNAMVNIVHLIVVFSMPAHRAAAFLGNDKKAFGESTLLRVIQYVAAACAPVYQEIFKQLAQSRRIQGDDSSTRVLAVEKKVRQDQGEPAHPEPPPLPRESGGPELESMMLELDALLGFSFDTKTGKPKKKLQVTMATGRVEAEDQFSQISFVRTHLGSFGNLLGQALKIRKPKHHVLTIQSDLSTANLPGPTPSNMTLDYAGCMAHARRPFWRYRDVDPLNCYPMLRGFMLLSALEDIIDCKERTAETTLHWRGRYGRKIWNVLKARCEKMMLEHMPTSEMHQSAKYIVTHFAELTHYLNDPWVPPTNNQVERILRSERTMLNNSKFRQSKKGRVAFDILRTMQLCCTGAKVPFLDYMKWVLVNHSDAKAVPANWTPYAYRLKGLSGS